MTHKDVIVVGARLAGAAAAFKLARAGKHVTVVEARDRCGGRGLVKHYAGEGPRLDPSDPVWVKAQAAKLFPNARVLSHDWHDWVDDPFARGTWVAAFAGHEEGLSADNWQPEGAAPSPPPTMRASRRAGSRVP